VLVADLIRLLNVPLRSIWCRPLRFRKGRLPGALAIDEDCFRSACAAATCCWSTTFPHRPHPVGADSADRRSGAHQRPQRGAVGEARTGGSGDEARFRRLYDSNEFVVGYGLDYCDQYRNLPHVAALEPANCRGAEAVKPLRVLIAARRFWPLVGGPERLLANLAVELSARGCPTTVLSAVGSPLAGRNPGHGVPVIRLAQTADHGWGNAHYLHRLARWLRGNRHRTIWCTSRN